MIKILTLLFFIPVLCFAQKQGNIWYFGNHAGLDFNSGSPVPITNGQTYNVGCPATCHSEGTAVISDSSGSLLFYTNGEKIWNRNHQVMANGNDLLGSASSTQSALIIPKPGSDRLYYVFTTDGFFVNELAGGFRYSIVDICADNGNGDVLTNHKNIHLMDTVAEKLTAVRHANGTDYWVIVHKYFSDAFYAYHLSETGIVNFTTSSVGTMHPSSGNALGSAIGQMKASPNGQKLAVATGNQSTIFEYFDFDPATGTVSNCVVLPITTYGKYYGVSFSPDNTKLYVTCSINCEGIYQFDLSQNTSAAVIASKTTIASQPNYLALQLASNGKIYVSKKPLDNQTYLSVIDNPNASGLNCNFIESGINVGAHVSYGLPNFVDSYSYSNEIPKCDFTGMEDWNLEKSSIYPNPFTLETTINLEHYLEEGTLTIYDTFGQEMKKIRISGQTITFQRDQMSAGVYVIRLIQDHKVLFTKKLVITD